MGNYTVEANNLEKTYTDAQGNSVTVFSGLTAAFEAGKVYAIFGPSGSGKSTLLNLIGALDSPDRGSLKVMGREIGSVKSTMANIRRDQIGFVFQSHYMNQKLTVYQNMELPLRINKRIKQEDYRAHITGLLELFGMEGFAGRYPGELSGGEQQRVCIARALANSPDIILADEPTGNLDEENERIVLEYLRSLTVQGKTVIIVTHNEAVKEYADVVYQLKKGQLLKQEKEEE